MSDTPQFWLQADVDVEKRTVHVRIVGNKEFLETVAAGIVQAAKRERTDSCVEWKSAGAYVRVSFHSLTPAVVSGSDPPQNVPPPPMGSVN